MTDRELVWGSVPSQGSLAELIALADRCGAVDGGLPLARTSDFLARRYVGDRIMTVAAHHPGGRLVAAAALRPGESPPGAAAAQAPGAPGGVGVGVGVGLTMTGLVDPAVRGRGVGGRLLDWAVEAAGRRSAILTIESEALTTAAAQLFGSRGFQQVFGEDVLRFDLGRTAPPADWPAGTTLEQWSAGNAGRFFAVYAAAFGDRPGFPGWSADRWISWTTGEGFRPAASVLVGVPGAGDVGFITCADDWIIQVGVPPALRGRGLGRALVCEALRRLRAGGSAEALLDVNVDNPAGSLYRRLGFRMVGRRARYRRPAAE